MEAIAKKEIGLVLCVSMLATITFGFFAGVVEKAFEQSLFTLLLIAVVVTWLATMSISLALTTSWSAKAFLILFPIPMIGFFSQFSLLALSAAALFSVFLLLAERSFVRELRSRISCRIPQVFGGGMRLLGLGLMIALTGVAWPTITESVGRSRFEISARQIQPLMRPIEPLIRDFFPGYTKEATIDQLLSASIEEEKKKLPPEVTIDPQQIERTRQELSRTVGQELAGHESLADIVAGSINRRARELTAQNPLVATGILVVIVFLTLRALLPFLVWPVMGLIYVMIRGLRATGIIVATTQPTTVERLSL